MHRKPDVERATDDTHFNLRLYILQQLHSTCTGVGTENVFTFKKKIPENDTNEYHKILKAYLGKSAPQTRRIRRHKLFQVGCKMQLNIAQNA